MDWPLFMARMSETWREGRKLLDRSLRPGAVMSYRQIVQENTREFLAQVSANPRDFLSHAKQSVSRLTRMARLLKAGQTSEKTYNVAHVWLRSEGW
jgi:cytochrome P450